MQDTDTGTNTAQLAQPYFRILICLAAAGTLAASTSWQPIDLLYAGFTIFLLCYLVATQFLLHRQSTLNHHTLVRLLEISDPVLIGSVLVLINFSLLPTVLFLTMIQFNGLLYGGLTKLFRDNMAVGGGILLALLIHQPLWALNTDLSLSLASLISVACYFCITAFYTSRELKQAREFSHNAQHLEDTYRNRMYKLSRYLPKAVWQSINDGRDNKLATDRKLLTIFFSDIKDFSQLAEELEAETLTEILNTYLAEMSKIINHYGGTLDKFMGDGMMVFFGDHDSKGAKQDAFRCVSMALAMRRRMKELQQVWHNQGIKRPLQIRIGINTGYCTVGTFGTSHHLDYTALGTHVNLASRLESAAQPGETLISYETWSLVKDIIMCRDKGEVTVKGFHHPIKVFQVINFRKELGGHQSYFEHDAEGFSLLLDLERIKNYDKERVLRALDEVHKALEDKVIV